MRLPSRALERPRVATSILVAAALVLVGVRLAAPAVEVSQPVVMVPAASAVSAAAAVSALSAADAPVLSTAQQVGCAISGDLVGDGNPQDVARVLCP